MTRELLFSINHPLIKKDLIPLDKSWIIRMGVLDIVNGYRDTQIFLSKQETLSGDLIALRVALDDWNSGRAIRVGESGTLYRFLNFAAWKSGKNKRFLLRGTLKKRNIARSPDITRRSQRELLKLDHGTSQWASAAALCGDTERLGRPPFKLALTYEAIAHWKRMRSKRKVWKPRYDATILSQAETFLKILRGATVTFVPAHSEDYCFAVAFGYLSVAEGERRWPSLKGHESNRIKEMSKAILHALSGKRVYSKDHRVVQAIAMRALLMNVEPRIVYPRAVNKSWPQFWEYLKYAKKDLP